MHPVCPACHIWPGYYRIRHDRDESFQPPANINYNNSYCTIPSALAMQDLARPRASMYAVRCYQT
jgi:hypothetical protein